MKSELQDKDTYTDQEINDLAEWLEELTLKQAFFLKESYESYLVTMAHETGCMHVH